MTMTIVMTVFMIGFLIGFGTYFACRMGYKALMEILEEENSTKKIAFSTTDQVNS